MKTKEIIFQQNCKHVWINVEMRQIKSSGDTLHEMGVGFGLKKSYGTGAMLRGGYTKTLQMYVAENVATQKRLAIRHDHAH